MARVLIAGIGNIFLGDDAFGVEVVRRLRARNLAPEIGVHDFGTRCLDLAYCLLDEWDGAILVDAVARGLAPGTVSVLDLDTETELGEPAMLDGHTIGVAQVRRTAQRLAQQVPGRLPRMFLVGCEPERFDVAQGGEALSPAVEAAVEVAVQAVLDRLAAIQEELCVGALK